MKKKLFGILSIVTLTIFAFSGCKNRGTTAENRNETGKKILKCSESFALETLNPHQDYQGWYTSIYGLTEALFIMNDQSSVEPMLAESAKADGNIWTIKLKEAASFSNGNTVTSDMVIRNLQNAGKTNSRFAYLKDCSYQILDDKTFTIETSEVYPTLLNDLASPELAIVDLDNSKDMGSQLVATGPFVVSSFEPGGTIKVKRNSSYWNGEVKLDGAEFYYMPEPDTSLMAMQNGEIDCYTGVTADAAEIFKNDPDTYKLVSIPATRLQFYILNKNRLDDSVRKAINLTIDTKAIETYLNGTVTSTDGPFDSSAPYGKVTKEPVDIEAAKALLEKDGYSLNADGYYEKDGQVLTINIAYYAARSLDTLATLMQEQLKTIGIKGTLTCEVDPDETYIATGDFDIALYCMIADKAGDPYYFISCTLAKGAPYNCGGFSNEKTQKLIDELKVTSNNDRRAELANEIVQTAIDEDAFGYVALFNKTTVMRNNVVNVFENCPFDFYFLNANTDMN
ncbi:ABC transporter substrate-binding protein [Anaerosacchariphilus polymeriproducens]|uniref:ABC transporter substrate-binding protein n=1 Tax=Anaerosacchariphilus polymeriproducens TaxID=1812858 RepID=A0A371AZB2_9FIRM|nr:ABC transporter substrate-binding protein [Anaerosacchariphilus polymeriproducens]RDU24934.1 ABC transporter substrate-binding protein [Anaerosacchariphilus polymeriproducens]